MSFDCESICFMLIEHCMPIWLQGLDSNPMLKSVCNRVTIKPVVVVLMETRSYLQVTITNSTNKIKLPSRVSLLIHIIFLKLYLSVIEIKNIYFGVYYKHNLLFHKLRLHSTERINAIKFV
jgi:hypothetical protein